MIKDVMLYLRFFIVLICLVGINASTTTFPRLESIRQIMLQGSNQLAAIQYTSTDLTTRLLAHNYDMVLWMTLDCDDATFAALIKSELQHRDIFALSVPYLCALLLDNVFMTRQLELHMDDDTIRLVRQHAQLMILDT